MRLKLRDHFAESSSLQSFTHIQIALANLFHGVQQALQRAHNPSAVTM
jgi:hypothetical protein